MCAMRLACCALLGLDFFVCCVVLCYVVLCVSPFLWQSDPRRLAKAEKAKTCGNEAFKQAKYR